MNRCQRPESYRTAHSLWNLRITKIRPGEKAAPRCVHASKKKSSNFNFRTIFLKLDDAKTLRDIRTKVRPAAGQSKRKKEVETHTHSDTATHTGNGEL